MKLSIIVPVYNVENYIRKCIKSIINQTLKDIEIIVVNDGSTDSSIEKIVDLIEKNNNIKILNKKNGGLSSARNEGLKIAKGEYVAFVDSDDWIAKDMYEKLYNLACENNADIVQCDYINAYSEDDYIKVDNKEYINKYTGEQVLHHLYDERFIKTVVVWNKIYRRNLFDNISFPEGKLHEDEFTTYKLIHKSKNIINTSLAMYFYRQREGSIMTSKFNVQKLDAIEAWRERKIYFKLNGLDDLVYKTESLLCGNLKIYYTKIFNSDVDNKSIILKSLRNEMKKNYLSFIKNKYIKFRGKMSLTMCIINGNIYTMIFGKHISNK